jgi:hypothetical protein
LHLIVKSDFKTLINMVIDKYKFSQRLFPHFRAMYSQPYGFGLTCSSSSSLQKIIFWKIFLKLACLRISN